MVGDQADFVARLRTVLPRNWFADVAPVLDSVLAGLGSVWSGTYGLLRFVQAQARIGTASGAFLDLIADDFFGPAFARFPGEVDAVFRRRLDSNILRARGTRQALLDALQDLTGRAAVVFEPARPGDTGGYSTGALAYGVAGAYGSLSLPFQCFVTAHRPLGLGIPLIGGYGGPGPLAYANLGWIAVEVTDADILKTIAGVMPVGSIAWTRVI